MTKNQALTSFLILVAALLLLVWFRTGSLVPPSGDDAIWFHAGLFTLLIGKYIVEYRFTRPNDVFVNCAIVFASTSILTDPPNSAWWQAVRLSSAGLGILAIGLAWDPGSEARTVGSKIRGMVYRIVTRLGRAEVIFSFVFILALFSFFDLSTPITRALVVFWGISLTLTFIELDQLIQLARKKMSVGSTPIGTVRSFLAPNIVLAEALTGKVGVLHDLVEIIPSAKGENRFIGMIIGNRTSPLSNLIVISLLNDKVDDLSGCSGALVRAVARDADLDALEIDKNYKNINLNNVVGSVAPGTNISRLKFEICGSKELTSGMLLQVKSGDVDMQFQIFDALIDEEATVDQSGRSYTTGLAEQVGVWSKDRRGFESHDWIARERSLVLAIDETYEVDGYEVNEREIQVGEVPKSRFPVFLNIDDWVLFHTAILGVTGAGKSFLTYQVIEEGAGKGVKFVCVDPTGDYQRYLRGAVLLPTKEHLKRFLNDDDHRIGIIETAAGESAARHPIETAYRVASFCLEWCKEHRNEDEVLNPKAKVQVVFEEAHLLIPEWNFNPERSKQDRVSQTAQVVLQARKYGLGFLIVSQRTANVVKSVLNQCNTIISFQAFDETSFAFLSNYMGQHHVKALPNLKKRQGIIVGKASNSNRPMMVHFSEQKRELRDEIVPTLEIPAAEKQG